MVNKSFFGVVGVVLVLAVVVFFPVSAGRASIPDDIAAGSARFIDSMGHEAMEFLQDKSLSKEQKQERLKRIMQKSFDMKTIGRFALGRYWRMATPAQRSEYQRLFEDMIISVYTSRFDEYKGEKFKVNGTRPDGKKGDVIVNSVVIPADGPEVQVDWRVRYKNNAYKVVDVVIEGVSMSMTQRSDFSSVIQRGGGNIEVLLAHLRNR